MRIIFARHGESQANLLREISNRGLKHPLTQKGRQQALLLAQKLQTDMVISVLKSDGLVCTNWNGVQLAPQG